MCFFLFLCLASPSELVFLSLMLKLLSITISYQFTPLDNVPKRFDHDAKMIIVISLINFLVGVKKYYKFNHCIQSIIHGKASWNKYHSLLFLQSL